MAICTVIPVNIHVRNRLGASPGSILVLRFFGLCSSAVEARGSGMLVNVLPGQRFQVMKWFPPGPTCSLLENGNIWEHGNDALWLVTASHYGIETC